MFTCSATFMLWSGTSGLLCLHGILPWSAGARTPWPGALPYVVFHSLCHLTHLSVGGRCAIFLGRPCTGGSSCLDRIGKCFLLSQRKEAVLALFLLSNRLYQRSCRLPILRPCFLYF